MARQLRMGFMPKIILCNRCNAEKPTTLPCEHCRCPEFRLVGEAPPRAVAREVPQAETTGRITVRRQSI